MNETSTNDYDEHWYGANCRICNHEYCFPTKFEREVARLAHMFRHGHRVSRFEQWNDHEERSPNNVTYLEDSYETRRQS